MTKHYFIDSNYSFFQELKKVADDIEHFNKFDLRVGKGERIVKFNVGYFGNHKFCNITMLESNLDFFKYNDSDKFYINEDIRNAILYWLSSGITYAIILKAGFKDVGGKKYFDRGEDVHVQYLRKMFFDKRKSFHGKGWDDIYDYIKEYKPLEKYIPVVNHSGFTVSDNIHLNLSSFTPYLCYDNSSKKYLILTNQINPVTQMKTILYETKYLELAIEVFYKYLINNNPTLP